MALEIGWRGGFAVLGDVIRPGEQMIVLRDDRALQEVGIRQRLGVAANGDVEAILDYVDDGVGRDGDDVDLGIILRKSAMMSLSA